MQTTTLRKVGGSVMMTVPPSLLEQLHLQAGSTVGIETDGERLLIKPRRPRYSLAELLAQCEDRREITADEREWLDAPAAGQEL